MLESQLIVIAILYYAAIILQNIIYVTEAKETKETYAHAFCLQDIVELQYDEEEKSWYELKKLRIKFMFDSSWEGIFLGSAVLFELGTYISLISVGYYQQLCFLIFLSSIISFSSVLISMYLINFRTIYENQLALPAFIHSVKSSILITGWIVFPFLILLIQLTIEGFRKLFEFVRMIIKNEIV